MSKLLEELESNERYDNIREQLMTFLETVLENDIMLIFNSLEPKDQMKFLESVIRKVIPSYSFDNTTSKKQEIDLVQQTKERIAKINSDSQGDGVIKIELTNPAKQQYKESKELKDKYKDMLEEDVTVEVDDIEDADFQEEESNS